MRVGGGHVYPGMLAPMSHPAHQGMHPMGMVPVSGEHGGIDPTAGAGSPGGSKKKGGMGKKKDGTPKSPSSPTKSPKGKKKPKSKKPKKKAPKPKAKKKPRKKQAVKKKAEKLTKTGRKKRDKDPHAPKRARTAFNFFLDEFRHEYKERNPEAKGVVGVTKAGSEKWREMPDEAKQPYEQKALEAREVYNAEKAKYLAGNGALLFKMKKGPPRPPTAYFMFLAEFRADYRKKHPNTKGIKGMSKEAGEKWRGMDVVTKRPFEMRAQAAKDEYLRLKNMSEEERVATIKQTVASGENIYDRFFQMNADATNAPATKPLPPKEGGEEGGMG